ncbi:hypothetical protein C2G38_2211234 [Gigaspora rosea]|uniref:Uncharacterized protein n=1 Tax=Gigaspora rosea TaxID=44941 RepID=A0A397UHB6_9GLOM|nr:hypothetical protein C2G38_2211234 [Gigaspora rosea]
MIKNINSGNYLQFSSCTDIRIGSVFTAGPVNKQKRKKNRQFRKSNTRVEESTSSRLHSKDESSSSILQQISAGPSGDVNNLGYDRPCTPPHQIHSISRNQDLLRQLREEKLQTKSEIKSIRSNIIDTTNKHLMERLL